MSGICCQLCGVSFTIARLRREDEPYDAAWSFYGADFVDKDIVDSFVNNGRDGSAGIGEKCQEGSGCKNVKRLNSFGKENTEHVAGPECVMKHGYSGHRISLEEMKV